MTIAPPKKGPPPPVSRIPPPANGAMPAVRKEFGIKGGVLQEAEKVIIYGPGGIGKTELASLLKDVGINPLFFDLEGGSAHIDVDRPEGIESWQDLRDALHSPELCKPYGAIVIDSLTKADELATAHTLRTVPHEKGHAVERIANYGYGKGFEHNYETFLQLLGDLDQQVRAGRHVVCIAHEDVTEAPNPVGENFLRYEPRLQKQKNGNIRARVKEWCGHLVFIGYDVSVDKDGKGKGTGTRQIYVSERPAWMAKSRSLAHSIPYIQGDATFWKQLLGKE